MQTEACRTAINQVQAHLNGADLAESALETAVAHMNTCAYCQKIAGHLLTALESGQEDALNCAECRERLPDYLQAQLESESDADTWRDLRLHLANCPSCTAEMTMLLELVELADSSTLIKPTAYPNFDLSFLPRKQAASAGVASVPWRLDEVGRLLIELTAELLQSFQPPTPQLASLKSSASERTICQFSVEDVDDLVVTVVANREKDDATRCQLAITADIPSRGGFPELAGTEVTLRRGEEMLDALYTDAFGTAVFNNLLVDDLTHLNFTIAPQS